jgi:hypothetical protein
MPAPGVLTPNAMASKNPYADRWSRISALDEGNPGL